MARVHVEVRDQNNFDKYMRIFKKECQKEGFLQEVKDRRYFLTSAERRKLKREKLRRGHNK